MEFEKFKPIPRLSREMVVTEKLDGTNASVVITEHEFEVFDSEVIAQVAYQGARWDIRAGSRKRWLGATKENDNYGFGRWVSENASELVKLGPGHHYGEWWGQGIQRGYDLKEKRFSLFNTGRWTDENTPSCVSVVPQLYVGKFDTSMVGFYMERLKYHGSYAAPGFMNPEGVVVFHTAANAYFKQTFEHDASGKPFGG